MNNDTFERAVELKATLRRVERVLTAIGDRGGIRIEDEHFSIKHPLGAAVLAEVEKYKAQLTDEFNKL